MRGQEEEGEVGELVGAEGLQVARDVARHLAWEGRSGGQGSTDLEGLRQIVGEIV